MSAIGEGTASNTLHEWQVDTYDSSADNASQLKEVTQQLLTLLNQLGLTMLFRYSVKL